MTASVGGGRFTECLGRLGRLVGLRAVRSQGGEPALGGMPTPGLIGSKAQPKAGCSPVGNEPVGSGRSQWLSAATGLSRTVQSGGVGKLANHGCCPTLKPKCLLCDHLLLCWSQLGITCFL